MRKVERRRFSKRAFTLVELIVSMALTSIFAASCVLLILPITKIYKHVNDLSRAQLLADTVVDSIRSECSGCFISGQGDVWIGNGLGSNIMTAANTSPSGSVLVIRKNKNYCETISANYEITSELRRDILENSDEYDLTNENGVTSRSIYRLIPSTPTPTPIANAPAYTDLSANIVHFGFFELETDSNEYIYPSARYDFTNPVGYATYRDFHVDLTFYDLTLDANDVPAYCMCKVDVLDINNSVVYSREVVLCF
jgi:prepilin-type N-terminal cleavage/methylation domain-containing protein